MKICRHYDIAYRLYTCRCCGCNYNCCPQCWDETGCCPECDQLIASTRRFAPEHGMTSDQGEAAVKLIVPLLVRDGLWLRIFNPLKES